jgi:hypothetical protein
LIFQDYNLRGAAGRERPRPKGTTTGVPGIPDQSPGRVGARAQAYVTAPVFDAATY